MGENGDGVSVAEMFSHGGFDDVCHRWCLSRIASACLSGCISVFVGFVGVGRDQLRSGLGFGSVNSDSQDVIDFVFWIGLDQQISFGRSGFRRLDLMLHVEPTYIAEASRS